MYIKKLRTTAKIKYTYVCENCGHLNKDTFSLREDTMFTSGAQARNADYLAADLERIGDGSDVNVYPDLKLKTSCFRCGAIPLWAQFEHKTRKTITRVLFALSALFFAIAIVSNGSSLSTFISSIIMGSSAFVAMLGMLIYRFIAFMKLSNKLEKLDRKYLPTIIHP